MWNLWGAEGNGASKQEHGHHHKRQYHLLTSLSLCLLFRLASEWLAFCYCSFILCWSVRFIDCLRKQSRRLKHFVGRHNNPYGAPPFVSIEDSISISKRIMSKCNRGNLIYVVNCTIVRCFGFPIFITGYLILHANFSVRSLFARPIYERFQWTHFLQTKWRRSVENFSAARIVCWIELSRSYLVVTQRRMDRYERWHLWLFLS